MYSPWPAIATTLGQTWRGVQQGGCCGVSVVLGLKWTVLWMSTYIWNACSMLLQKSSGQVPNIERDQVLAASKMPATRTIDCIVACMYEHSKILALRLQVGGGL